MSTYRTHRIVVASLFLPHTAVLGESAPTPARSPSSNGSLNSKLSGGPKGIVEALQDAARGTPIATPGAERGGFFASTTPGASDSVAATAVSGFANALSAAGSAVSNAASAVAGAVPGATAPVSTPAATADSNVPILRPKMLGPLKSIVEDMQDKSRNVTPQPTPGVELINPFSTPLPARQPGATSPPHHGPSRLTRKSTLAARAMSKSRSYTSDSLSPGSPELASGQLWHVEPNSAANGGLHNAINSVKERLKEVLWVGTLGTATDTFDAPTRLDVDTRLRSEHASLPVWIPDAEFRKFYDEFCHQVLWPALHYAVPDAPKTKSFFESSAWKEYVSVNTRFADAIAATHKEGDIIFVNDYHLLLLPQLLRERLPTCTIGFFLHVAFPSSEIFRCLAVREKLLKGALGADLLGFQTANHARHFRQTVSRILSLEATPRGIQGEERFVDVGVFPMGIDVGSITARRNDPEVKEWIETLQQRYAGFKLLVGRDKLDEVQGVKHKLLAFELFLEKYPEFQGKVVLIQVALQTTEQNESQSSVGAVVSRINGRFASLTYTPVVFLHTHDLTFAQYLALLTVADAFVVTSVREGMALRAHEFVECQADRKRPLILSEFTGSYTYRGFRSCIAINPWDKRGTAQAMHTALTMPQSEAESRWEDLHAHVSAQSAQTFVHGFLQRTLRAGAEHVRTGEAEGPVGGPPRVDVASVLPRWKHSDRRFVGVDLEGTIWRGRDPRDSNARPDVKVVETLRKLSEDSKNALWIFSGLPIEGALEELGHQIPRAGVVAENGCFIRPPAEEGGEEEAWMSMVESKNLDWKGPCLEILHYFTERTPGAYVEERKASVVWRYWTQWDAGAGPAADRAWARRQAAEAQNHIFDSIGERFGLRIVPGANSFLVLPSDVSRATAFSTILDPGGPVQNPRLRALHTVTSNPPSSPGGITDSPGPGNLLRKPRRQSSSRVMRGEEAAFDVLLVLSQDERLLRRVGEQEGAETVSVNAPNVVRATEARWSVGAEEALDVMEGFVGVGA